jgi:hypothetical protein
MPNPGLEIIDGIPVILKDGQMLAFQTHPPINLGTYDSVNKKASWTHSEEIITWLSSYQSSLVSKSRK